MRPSRRRLIEHTTQLTAGAVIAGISAVLVRRRLHGGERGPEHRTILVIDMVGSCQWHNPDQLRARAALTSAVRTAFHSAGISWSQLPVEDRGDGMIVLVPAMVSKLALLDPFVPCLAAAIGRHNLAASDGPRIRLRVALHAGEVHRDARGWAGADLNMACRLVNDDAVYQPLRRHPQADLVLIVSDLIRNGVVRHAYRGIDPDTYTGITVAVKECHERAWIHVPGLPPAAGPVTSVFPRRDAG
jgi:hypothetical protein